MQLLDEYDRQYPMQDMGQQYDMYDDMYYDMQPQGEQGVGDQDDEDY